MPEEEQSPSEMPEGEIDPNLGKPTSSVKKEEVKNPSKGQTEFKPPAESQSSYATFSEEFEKYKIKVDVVKWLIGTIGLTLITFIINWGFKDRETGLNEIALYTKFVDEKVVLNRNPQNRLLIAEFYSTVTPSEQLRKGWGRYLEITKEENKRFLEKVERDSLSRIQANEDLKKSIEKKDTLKQKLYSEKVKELDQRMLVNQSILHEDLIISSKTVSNSNEVYIHIFGESQRTKAAEIESALKINGFKVAGIELIRNQQVTNKYEIRYFKDADISASSIIKNILEKRGLNASLNFMPQLRKVAKDGAIEVWLK